MKVLASIVAVFIIVVGIAGVAAPATLVERARTVISPGGLWLVAAIRVAIGLILVLAAPASRTPKTLRVIGVIAIVAGIATPLFGVDRSRAVLEWGLGQGTAFVRVLALVVVAFGAFILYSAGMFSKPSLRRAT